MKRRQRNLLILLAVFAALLIVALLQSQPQSAAPINPAATLSTFSVMGKELNMTVLDIIAIRLRDPNSNQSFIISRDASGNWIAPENKGSLDPKAASTIAKTMVLFPYQNTTPITETSDLKQYGFKPEGQLSVEILLQNKQSHVIAIGSLSPSQAVYYALVDNLPKIYFLERAPVDFLLTQLKKPPLT